MEQGYSEKGDTWPKVLRYNYERYGDSRKAMRYKYYGIWQTYTWQDYYLSVKYLALGLLSLGFEPGDKVLIIGDNAPQWYYAELAAQANHGASVGLYSDSIPKEIEYVAGNSEVGFAIAQDQEQVDKILRIRDGLPLLRKIIFWSYKGLAHYDAPILTAYSDVLRLGEEYDAAHPGHFERNVEAGKADDVCAIVYTSGTSGDAPKGAVHTYETMRAGAEYLLRLDSWHEDDNVLPYLPPAGMTEQWFGIGCHLLSANILNFAEAPETQTRDTRDTGPSIVYNGARVWEAQAAMAQARILDADAVKRFAYRLLMPTGNNRADLRYRKQERGLFRKIVYALADMVLFRPIRKSLGLSNARICYSTDAMLSPDAARFYHALNLPLKSLYGSTEGGTLTGAANDDIRLKTVGPAHKGTEVRVTDAGELIYRQPGIFVRYYKDPDKTAEVLKDGWFYSGDSGYVTEDGHIVLADRLKDLIELENGDTLAPQDMECRLRFSSYIKDAWVLADPERTSISAVIIINYDTVSRWAGQKRVAFTSFAELSQAPEVYALVRQDIERVNRTVSPGLQVKKFVNLHKELDPDEGELTRTRKLRRAFLQERYRDLIDAVYSDKTEAALEVQGGYPEGLKAKTMTTIHIESVQGAG
jgi:long-chain acyl-CoA synthetase